MPAHASYTSSEWDARHTFVTLINEICAEQAITITWYSDHWIARLGRDGATCYLHGYTFPLNSAVAAWIARDKAATATLLADHGVAVIPHHLVRLSQTRQADLSLITRTAALPLVIKPNAGESGGFDVMSCRTAADLTQAVASLAARHRVLAVGPLVAIAHEYRVVMLDGTPLITYEKHRVTNEWRHNLNLGATPELVAIPRLTTLARQALGVVQGRVASVDIADTPNGLQVMEINGGICLSHFSKHSPAFRQLAKDTYLKIMVRSLQQDAIMKSN